MRTERFLHEAVGVSLGKIDFSVVPLHVQYIFCGADCPELWAQQLSRHCFNIMVLVQRFWFWRF